MAERVFEVMNREVLSFEADGPAAAALELMLHTGVTAAPVVDRHHHPVGVVSIRELCRPHLGVRIGSYMRAPALVTTGETSLLEAARLLDEASLHHLCVVDADGSLVGFTSSLDLLRGIIGAPARHPETFSHYDRELGVAFTDDQPLDPEHVGDAPHAPGIIVLSRGGAGRRERIAWVQTTLDIKEWLRDFFSQPTAIAPGEGALRYRYAQVDDVDARAQIALLTRTRAAPTSLAP